MIECAAVIALRCVIITPFGRPVEPDVYTSVARSISMDRFGGGSEPNVSSARTSSKDTTRRPFGCPAAASARNTALMELPTTMADRFEFRGVGHNRGGPA